MTVVTFGNARVVAALALTWCDSVLRREALALKKSTGRRGEKRPKEDAGALLEAAGADETDETVVQGGRKDLMASRGPDDTTDDDSVEPGHCR